MTVFYHNNKTLRKINEGLIQIKPVLTDIISDKVAFQTHPILHELQESFWLNVRKLISR